MTVLPGPNSRVPPEGLVRFYSHENSCIATNTQSYTVLIFVLFDRPLELDMFEQVGVTNMAEPPTYTSALTSYQLFVL